jgi:hypothetical protein
VCIGLCRACTAFRTVFRTVFRTACLGRVYDSVWAGLYVHDSACTGVYVPVEALQHVQASVVQVLPCSQHPYQSAMQPVHHAHSEQDE